MSLRFDPPTPPSDDDYFMGVALAVRRKANCTGNRVAAIIVKDKRIIATVFGGTSTANRNAKMAELMDIGFGAAKNRVKEQPPQAPAPLPPGWVVTATHPGDGPVLAAAPSPRRPARRVRVPRGRGRRPPARYSRRQRWPGACRGPARP